jgi:hypothetical protein
VREYPAGPLFSLQVVREYPADSPPLSVAVLAQVITVDSDSTLKMALSMEELRIRLQARHVAHAGVSAGPIATHPAAAMSRSMNGVLAQSIIQIRRAQGTVPAAEAKPAAAPIPELGNGTGASFHSLHPGVRAGSCAVGLAAW